ncbi:GNAT family protein [Ornithinibacillus halophilus]|uniref:N-acetyltransferase domain-containing protein n=1 Tax=Ornithinibacillus halophilus TaxID=930117 RepID=A0A1M5DTQ9_9BACI|nr:hypothetical protein [Ornithinibacillus halophilus]SHF70339.1 hypothetical protein SAMN05216225_10032 [Ornithinibacillus halophilus]
MDCVLSLEFAKEIERMEIAMLESRLRAIREQKENPMGVEVQHFGEATAFSATGIPGPSFNTVKGLTGGDIHYLDSILEFYDDKGITPRFDLVPGIATEELFPRLHENGYYQNGFHASLYGAVGGLQRLSNEITIREMDLDDFDTFADIYVKGFQMPDFLKEAVANNNRVLHGNDSWKFYLASINDTPAGLAVLYKHESAFVLAASATLTQYRNKGIHQALIQRRISDAKENDVKLVIGQAAFGSSSQKNMERAGLKIAYTKATWEKY